jgi:FimV-like protein
VVQAPTKVSSLQQLLALKSRVLMELLKHGIGGTPVRPSQAGSAATAAGSQMAGVAAAASGASVPGNAGMANSHAAAAGNIDLSPENLGIPAAIGAVLVALLAGLGLRRRKRAAITREVPEAFPAGDTVEAHEDVAARERALADEVAAREAVAREVAEREAAAREAQAREAAEHEAAAREAAEHEALAREAEAHEAAARETAEREAAAREAAARDAALLGGAVSQASAGFPHDVAGHEPAADQGTAAPQEIASESRPSVAEGHQWDEATATPPEEIPSTEPVASFHPPQPQINFGAPPAEHDGEPNHGEALFEPEPNHPAAVTPPESHTPSEHHAFEPTPYADEAPHHSGTPTGASPDEPFTESPTEPAAPGEFPRDAVDAFGSLDLGLPPRIESPDTLTPPAPLATQPAVEPEISAQQTVAPQAAARRQVADEIAAGTAGAAAVTGLGAARFGALNLDFDLELPPSPAQPLPSFTPQDLVRIARNKLDLASEYIELGDLAGARALIHEVIEANDVATRTAARALLSTLAPLS